MKRAFGITADTPRIERIAAEVESLGYATFWTNDTPGASGLAAAVAAARATTDMRIGVGVIPCDRRPAPAVVEELANLEIPADRFVLGVGAGFSSDPLGAVRSTVEEIRASLEGPPAIGVAAMGARMCALAGELGDVVLLNWMTPARIAWALRQIEKGATDRRPEIASYVRAALGEDAGSRIAEEALRYASMPHYRRHFEAMGAEPSEVGVALGDAEDPLEPYDRLLDEVVVRALPRGTDETDEIVQIARSASSPGA